MARIPPDAFEYYVSLGTGRSYDAVARRFGVSKRAITKRAATDRWRERLAQIEATARERTEEKLAETLEAVNGRHLKTLRVIQAKALQALQSMALDSAMDAVRALDLAIRNERVILGEPGERTAVSVEDVIRREYERWMTPAGAATGDDGTGGADGAAPR